MTPDLIVLHEHPEWQKPLFAALSAAASRSRRSTSRAAAFSNVEPPRAPLYFNQASPSAYLRGHTRAVPLALAYMRIARAARRPSPERRGRVRARAEQERSGDAAAHAWASTARARSPSTTSARCAPTRGEIALAGAAQARSGRQRRAHSGGRVAGAGRGDLHPRSGGVAARQSVPAAGVSAARSRPGHRPPRVSRRRAALRDAREDARALQPVPLAGLQSRRRRRRLRGADEPTAVDAAPVEFLPYPEVPHDAVETATRIVRAARLDVGGIEYLETDDGRRVFYDINANSNLRPSVAAAFGFDPFERVVDFSSDSWSSMRLLRGLYGGDFRVSPRPRPIAVAFCAVVFAATLSNAGQPRSVSAGVYSAAQAARGEQLYRAHCGDCHGRTLEGAIGPPLVGESFLANWSARPLAEAVDKIQKTMPFEQPGSLSRSSRPISSAYVLQAGSFPPGRRSSANVCSRRSCFRR